VSVATPKDDAKATAPAEQPREEPLDAAGRTDEPGHSGQVVHEVGLFVGSVSAGVVGSRVSHRIFE